MIRFLKKIEKEIGVFDKKFKNSLSTKANLLHKVTNYLGQNPGKKIRPICTIISAGLVNNITDKTYRGAILIELLHTATLIHDDIVDDAHLRRSKFSINTIWKNKIAVLTGDYFLAKGLTLAVRNKDYDILNKVSSVVEKIVEGELLQIEKTKKLNLNEKDYFKIINLKTGSLFTCAFSVGGLSSHADTSTVNELTKLGIIIGQLFQIKDDILDYSESKLIGKNSSNDIKEGKINLPLLYALRKMKIIEKGQVLSILRKKMKTSKEINLVKSIVIKYKGLEYANVFMEKNYQEALAIIDKFSENKYKNTMQLLLRFLMERKK